MFQFSAAAITVFLSWFELLLLLQRFDQIGIYVVMFLEILQTLIKVLMLFSILIIAFGLAFYILLSKVGSELNDFSYVNVKNAFELCVHDVMKIGLNVLGCCVCFDDSKPFKLLLENVV